MRMTKKRVVCFILILCFLVMAVIAGFQAYRIYAENQSGEDAYTDLEQYVRIPDQTQSRPDPSDKTSETSESEEESESNFPEIDFESLREVNDQVVGWIYCEDTAINYPIAQAEDNDYYLHHLFDGNYNSTGCIFLDCRNSSDFSDRHSIIYGHHLRSGNMFAGLMEYKDQAYYEAHPRFLLMTPRKNYTVEVFAGYVASVQDEAWKVDFGSGEAYLSWLEESMEKSAIQTGIVPAATDKILTLSTCSYEFDNARFVLLGILRDED